MELQQAVEALKPFTSKVPTNALDAIRAQWNDVEPILLAELDHKLAHPTPDDRSALFLYAVYLCAEMRASDAFERYLDLCRLPNVLLDEVLGDILTEAMPEMLARTCGGRIDDLKALVEDRTANEFARGSALYAMLNLMLDGDLGRDELMKYCILLLGQKLERLPSHIWDEVISVATDIHPKEAMPFIEKAYARKLADPHDIDLDYVQSKLKQSGKRFWKKPGGGDANSLPRKRE